jgi:uncharacterized membrane-anchored protein YitT (DUF2179 family)
MKTGGWKHHLTMILSILIGNTLLAFGICAFVVPNGIMLGGSTGISLAVQHLLPEMRLSVISAIINGVLFLLGLVFLGKKFAATSLLSTIIFPVILAVFETLPLGNLFHEGIVLSALACAVVFGLGIGMVVRAGGSTGGMDIPPIILQKFKGIPVGTSMMFFDSVVVLLQVAVSGLDGILCSLLVIVVMSATVNKALVSGEKKVQVMIFSPAYEQIRKALLEQVVVGVTLLNVETGYDGLDQKAVLSVVYARKYPEIRETALSIDPKAFIVTSDVTNVNGKGYTLHRYDGTPL